LNTEESALDRALDTKQQGISSELMRFALIGTAADGL